MEEILVRGRDSKTSSNSNEDKTITHTNGDNGDLKPLVDMKEEEIESSDGPKNRVYFDQNKGDAFGQQPEQKYIKAKDFSTALQNVNGDQNGDSSLQSGKSQAENTTPSSGFNKGKSEHIKFGIEEENTDDYHEVIELEFLERQVHKLHTHDMYCPNCRSQITKVVLRRRIVKNQVIPQPSYQHPDQEQEDLFGCLSCLRIFIRKGREFINCFGLCGESPKPSPIVPDDVVPIPDPVTGGGGSVPPQPPPPPRDESEKPEVIKSIVYGGLTESITSLTVITSAAASQAATLNIVALGFANLIGGLSVIGQSLLNLKRDNQQEHQYKEVLGQKRHFLLHAALAILSYLVSGLVPPVVYGFTFRETDDRDYKLLAVAAASVISIVFLAIGKAYVQARQEHKFTAYLKTVLYYLTTAVMASGVGFAVGDLVNRFMEKLGWFQPNQAGTLQFPGTQSLHPSFAAY